MRTRRDPFATATARTGGTPLPHVDAPPPPVLALTHATLINTDDTASRAAIEDRTLLISDGRITCTGPSAQLAVPRGARTIDLTGKYVIPGLVESHVHSTGPTTVEPPLFPLNGVTTTRQMWGVPLHHTWREEISGGRLLGPRMVIAGVMLDGAPSLWTDDTGQELIEVADESAARRAVRRVKREGADFVKVYSRLTPAAYFAVADEARIQNLPYAGHCPDQVTVAQASAAGQQSIEHLHALVLATASPEKEREIGQALLRIQVDPKEPSSLTRYASWFRRIHALEWEAVRAYDAGRARALFDLLAANGTRVVPTLSVHHALERTDRLPATAEEWQYLPPWQVGSWPQIWQALTGSRTAQETDRIHEIYEHRLHLVAELHRAGVQLLAGTDTGTGYLVPGFSLHGELELLAEAGLSPYDALRTATANPARLLDLPGDAADLVVLDANPLLDIRHTRRINAVVAAGRFIGGTERAQLLAEVAKSASRSEPPQGPAVVKTARCC